MNNPQYDNTNKGRMWSAGYHKILFQGDLDIEGNEINVAIVEKKNKDGSTVQLLYQSMAKLFDSNNEDIKYSTTLKIGQSEYKLWIREKTSAKGTDYLALSCKEKDVDATKF